MTAIAIRPTTDAATLQARGRPATRSGGDDLRTVPAMLRSELVKLTSLRANWAVLALTGMIGVGLSWALATFMTGVVLTVAEVFLYSTVLSAVLAAVVGILLFSSEAQHGTLASTLAARPARWVVSASKTVTAAVVGLVLGVSGMAGGLGGALLGGLAVGDTSDMVTAGLWALLFTSMAAVLGLGIGMVVRHSAGATSGLLIWMLVVEQSLTVFLPEHLSRFLPFAAGNGLLPLDAEGASPEMALVALSAPQNALVFGGYTVLTLLLGTVLLYRRDTN